jgi:translation initiation factor IF-1
MSKGDLIDYEGTIQDSCGGGFYKVKIDDSDTIILAHLSGKMKTNKILVLPGDKVKLSVSPYDTSKGIITFRSK